ncbi:AsmA-like C-terminal region-containing protein [Pelobium manganitolerans]|uniref:AsmA-like C-terminal region-containing protein n=1 Tax=Pelobium manganitolerans TaxID=1842495 RepID=UPI003FA38968
MNKKIVFGILGGFMLLIIALACVPFIFKDKIVAGVKTAINKNVNAKVDFKDVDVSLLSSFPNLGLQLNDLVVVGLDSFANDTLANIKKLELNLNLMSVIKGESYQINSINLINPNIYAKVLKSGRANWDIMKTDSAATSTPDTAQTKFKASLQRYSIKDGHIIYDDASLGFLMDLKDVNHSGTGDFTQDLFTLKTESDVKHVTMKYGAIPYLNDVQLSADLPIDMDLKNMKFSFGNNQIHLNELVLGVIGSIAMPNDSDIAMDLKFDAKQSDLKNFLSLIPSVYASNFKDLDASGKFAFNGFAKGTYNEKSLPAFDVNLSIQNGKMKYTGLPAAVNNIQVKANISNPDGVMDHTVVNVPAFSLAFDKAPVNGRLLVKTPISDPYIDMALKGKLDLKQLTNIFPMKDMTLSGMIDADVQAKGNKSAVDKQQFQNFNAAGQMLAHHFVYTGESVAKPVEIASAKLTFSPKNITLGNLDAKIGKSDFFANGSITNYLAYLFSKNQALSGTFNLTSNLLDINELMGPENKTEAKTAESELSLIKVPANINFLASVDAKRVLYDSFDIANAKGALLVKDESVYFKDLGLQMLGGAVKMNGMYTTKNPKKPFVDIDFGLEKMNIQKAFSAVNTIKLLAPVAKYTNGVFSTKLKFSSELQQNMMPVYSSINASGLANIIEAVVEGFEPLNKLAAGLSNGNIRKLELHDLLTKFNITDGRLNVAPFNIKKGDILMNVQGSNGLDQSLDYVLGINMPRALLGKANDKANSLIASLNSKIGSNVSVNESVKINALLGGTITKPTLKLDLAGDLKNEAKSVVNQLVADKKAELETKAKEEVQKLTDQAKEQLQQKADTLKKQTEQRIKQEVKNKLNNFFKQKKDTL